MKKILLIGLTMSFLTAVPILWAVEDQPRQGQPSPYSGYEKMGPGMMGSGSGYHGRGSRMNGVWWAHESRHGAGPAGLAEHDASTTGEMAADAC